MRSGDMKIYISERGKLVHNGSYWRRVQGFRSGFKRVMIIPTKSSISIQIELMLTLRHSLTEVYNEAEKPHRTKKS